MASYNVAVFDPDASGLYEYNCSQKINFSCNFRESWYIPSWAMKYSLEQIVDLYSKEAQKHKDSGTSTIQDIRTRNLEMQAIFGYIKDGMEVLEIGCGNGYTAQSLVERLNVELDAFDFTQELIDIAKLRNLTRAKGKVNFFQHDVLKFEALEKYDLVFTERVLQNLLSWEDQKKALKNVVASLKKGGLFVMEESFWSGLNNLNAARKELDLEPISESWHNLYFHDDQVIETLTDLGTIFIEENCFLSGYYFGSRVLLPALMPQGKTVSSKSILNDYFCSLPPAGNFSPMKILVFKKS